MLVKFVLKEDGGRDSMRQVQSQVADSLRTAFTPPQQVGCYFNSHPKKSSILPKHVCGKNRLINTRRKTERNVYLLPASRAEAFTKFPLGSSI